MSQKPRGAHNGAPPRKVHSISAKLSAEEYAALALEWQVRGCTPTDFVRAALKLEEAAPRRPLLVAAGQLIRAGNAHAGAVRRGHWRAAAEGIDELNRHAAELIRLAVRERSRR